MAGNAYHDIKNIHGISLNLQDRHAKFGRALQG